MTYIHVRGDFMEFSKKLAISIFILFTSTWVILVIYWISTGILLPKEILEFISIPFGLVITGYFTKAGVENYSKIKNSVE